VDQSSLETKRDALFRDLAALRDLPPAPRTLDDVWKVLGEDSSSLSALADVLQRDPALTAKVVRLANSAYYGLPRPVSEVRTACIVLGFDTIRALAVGVSVLDALSRNVAQALDLDRFWRHSVGVATAAQALARRTSLDVGTAFCAGVLHDIGKLVLATLSPARWRRAEGPDAASAERSEFGATHPEIGAWLGKRWHFPSELLEGIREHHEPAPGVGPWGALVQVADGIAHRGGCPSPGSGTPSAADPTLLARASLDAAACAAVESGFAFALERVEAFADAARSGS
jgi:putative nucleotidyltransferase with HDIG domain